MNSFCVNRELRIRFQECEEQGVKYLISLELGVVSGELFAQEILCSSRFFL